jgi:hypothetical protein
MISISIFQGSLIFFGGADQRRRVAKRDVYSIGGDIDTAEQTNRPGRDSACLFARTAVINCLKLTREAEEDAEDDDYSRVHILKSTQLLNVSMTRHLYIKRLYKKCLIKNQLHL